MAPNKNPGHSGGDHGQKGVEQPSCDAQETDSYVADHQQGFSCGLFQCIFHSPLYPLCARVMWMDMKMGADISIGLETIASPVNH